MGSPPCGQQVPFTVHGTRDYAWSSGDVKGGRLSLKSPGELAQPFSFRFGLGPEAILANSGYGAAFRLWISGLYRPESARKWGFELRNEYQLSRQGYVPYASVSDEFTTRELAAVTYLRASLVLVSWYHLGRGVRLGLGLGGGVATPVLQQDFDKVGLPQPFLAPFVGLSWALTHSIGLEAIARGALGERRYQFDSRVDGSPHRSDIVTNRLVLGFNLAITL